jgi:hypothetical protein
MACGVVREARGIKAESSEVAEGEQMVIAMPER